MLAKAVATRQAKGRALDVGCGAGVFSVWLAQHGYAVTALDLFPDVIVNAAAITEVPQCDADPVRSQAINVGLPATLAQVSHHLGARLIHLSSEQVFDGTRAPYRPADPVSPLNLYARQKVESEELVARFAPEIRTGVVEGHRHLRTARLASIEGGYDRD